MLNQHKMKRLFFALVGVVFAVWVVAGPVLAANQPVNSYELFWPIVAGKTMADKVYFLKIFKENLRGFTIGGPAQKADYLVLLVIKRVVEAEKLIGLGKTDLAVKTLQKAGRLLNKAVVSVEKAKIQKVGFSTQASNMSNKLSNLEIFLPPLLAKAGQAASEIESVLAKVILLKSKL